MGQLLPQVRKHRAVPKAHNVAVQRTAEKLIREFEPSIPAGQVLAAVARAHAVVAGSTASAERPAEDYAAVVEGLARLALSRRILSPLGR